MRQDRDAGTQVCCGIKGIEEDRHLDIKDIGDPYPVIHRGQGQGEAGYKPQCGKSKTHEDGDF